MQIKENDLIEVTDEDIKDGTFIIPNGIKIIDSFAFFECTNLTSITIPSGVTTIGKCAFARCINLTNVIMSDSVTTIGDSAFSNCMDLCQVFRHDFLSKPIVFKFIPIPP